MSQGRRISYWNLSFGALIAILLAIPVWLGADLSVLLSLAVMFAGIGLFATVLREWTFRRTSSAHALAGCTAGVLFMVTGGLRLASLPEGARGTLSVVISLLTLVALAFMVRLQPQPDRSPSDRTGAYH